MAKKRNIHQEIVDGLKETKDFLDGRPIKGTVSVMYNGKRICIREIRKTMDMTSEQFAEAFHFTQSSIQNWERGFNMPSDHTLAYLCLIADNPKKVYKTLHADN